MNTEEEAIHFLKTAELQTGKTCFVRHVTLGTFEKWNIYTSEEDYISYRIVRKTSLFQSGDVSTYAS